MKKPTAKLNTAAGLAWDRWVLALLLLGIINQGSYFPGGIVSIVGVLAFCCIVKRVSLGVKHLPFLLFCGWFLFCSVQNGFVIEYAAMGLLPASAFLFYLLVTQTVADRQRFLRELVKGSAVIAVLAVTVTLFRSLGSLSLQRTAFPFGYANSAGIFYGVMLLLTVKEKGALKYLFAVTLLLTQSVGAILVTLLLLVVTDFKNKRNLVLLGLVILFGLCFKSRIAESVYTFVERLLQAYDGFWCMLKHPLFGIGVGRWEVLRPYFQSGVYTAKIIHSIPIQIGVSSGVIGVLLFGVTVAQLLVSAFRQNRNGFWVALALVLHSLLDVTFAYGALAMLSACLVAEKEPPQKQRIWDVAVFVAVLWLSAVLGLGIVQTQTLKNQVKAFSYPRATTYYESTYLPRYSGAGQMEYLKALYAQGRYAEALTAMDEINPKSDDHFLLSAWCGDADALYQGLSAQPYNEKLYDELKALDPDAAEQFWQEGLKGLSPLGRILYYREGAKQE